MQVETLEIKDNYCEMNKMKEMHIYDDNLVPRGGIGVFVVDPINNKILIGKRKDNGKYAQLEDG